MNKGTIQQIATTTEIYERPANDFVADFVGESNIFHGTLTEPGVVTLSAGRRLLVNGSGAAKVGDRRGVLMRPERFANSGANTFTGEVLEAVYLGASFKLRLACSDGLELLVRQPARGLLPAAGQSIEVGIDPDAIHVF
jgi:putative spermidine/putrescine transport system ATP-binding protein